MILPDGVIQRMRVGATTGLAAKYLARDGRIRRGDARLRLAGGAQIAAIREVRKVTRIRCYSPNAERRLAFAQEMRGKTGVEIVASASGREAVRGADVVLCATNSWSHVLPPTGSSLASTSARCSTPSSIRRCSRRRTS